MSETTTVIAYRKKKSLKCCFNFRFNFRMSVSDKKKKKDKFQWQASGEEYQTVGNEEG